MSSTIPSLRYVLQRQLYELLANKGSFQGCTDSCEAGPFYYPNAPELPSGTSLAKAGTTGEPMFFYGTIKDTKGRGIKGAKVDVVSA